MSQHRHREKERSVKKVKITGYISFGVSDTEYRKNEGMFNG